MKNVKTFNLLTFTLLLIVNFLLIENATGQCNPDNPSAPPYCAPAAVCGSGNLLWSQSINSTDGSASLRMYCGSTTSFTIPGPYPASFGSGALLITVSDAVSYDGYSGRNTVSQPNERWRIIFKKSGTTVGASNYTGDVPDNVTQGYWRGSLGSVYVPNGVDQIIIEHWSVAEDCNSPNSVVPTSVCINATPYACNSTIPSLCDANILKAYSVQSPGTFCSPDSWTGDQHAFSLNGGPNIGAYQIKPGTTPRIIEYADGTVRGVIEVSRSLGTVGNVDNTKGYIIEITGSQKTTGNPASPWTPATGCGINAGSTWVYYNVFTMKVCGTGGNAGHNFTVTGAPQANDHVFQIGTGANTWNTSLGGGIWFTPASGGDLQFRLTQITASPITVSAGANSTICYNTSKSLTATASGGTSPYTFNWSNGLGSGATKTVTPTSTTTYTVTATDAAGCSGTSQVTVTVNPQLTLNMPDISVCAGPNVTVTASAFGGTSPYTYNWSSGLGTGSSKSIPATNATYTVTVTDNAGCTASDPFTVTVGSISASATNDGPLTCTKTSVTLTANPATGVTYAWSGGGTSRTKTVTTAGTYTVTVSDGNGCTAVATTTVTGDTSVPAASASNDGPLSCTKTSVTLTATGGGTYAWSGGGTGSTKVVTTAGTYTVTVTGSNGCTAIASTTVTGDTTVPAASASNDGPLTCTKTSVTLTANPATGVTYAWSGGGTSRTKTVTTAGTYTVTVTGSNGCTAIATTTVTGDTSVPNPTASNDGPLTCTKTSVTLTATGGGTYAWSGGGTGSTKVVTTAGTYTVTVTGSNGCTGVATTTVTSDTSVPSASASNDGPLTCTKTSVTLTANPATGVTYAWSGGGTSRTKTVTTAGTYTVTVTGSNGCTAVATTTVTSDTSVPAASASNDGPLTCTKTSVTLTANPATGVTYAWSGGGTSRTKTVTTAGTYTVTVTGSNGCTAVATTVVSQDVTVPAASADNTGGPLSCTVTSVTIRAFPNDVATYTYSWAGPGGYTSSSRTNVVSSPGTYTVTITNINNGCSATASTTVQQDITTPSASANNDGPLTCIKTSVTLTALPGTGVTYAWSGGGSTQTKAVTTPGIYTVTVTNTSNGCTAIATTQVTQDIAVPAATASNDGPLLCNKTSVTLTANPATGVTYAWSGGGSSRTKTVTIAGTYTVTVTNISNGCTALATTTVSQNVAAPNATADNIGGPLTCTDNSATIRAFPDIATYTYSWSGPGGYTATSRTNNVSVAGTYTVTVTDTQNGCTAIASTAVLQDVTVPTVNAGPDKTICSGTSTTLTATGSGTYLWNTGATTAAITVTPVTNTTYTVTVTGSNGCTASDQAVVTVTPLPLSGITGPLEICAEEYAVFNASPAVSGATYAWTFDGGTSLDGDANDVTESIKWATSYYGTTRTVTLVVTKDNCSSTYTKPITIKQPASLNTQDNYPVCQGGTVQIGPNPNDPNQVTPGSTFQWTPNLFLNSSTVAQPLSTPPFDITYTLTATVNGCAVSKQITVDVNVNLNPIADAGPDKTICITESTQIGGSPTATPPPAGGATINGVLWTVPPSGTITSTLSNPLVSPTTNTQYRVVVVASNGCTDTDFVNVTVTPKSKIGNYTWIDANANGCQESTEAGINGITVTLYTSGGTVVGTTTTANNPSTGAAGYYSFDVCPGSYYVNFGKPTGYAFTGEKTCGNTASDSDANTTTGNSMLFTVISGQDNLTIDAGYQPLGNIRGNVLADTNNDNVGDTPMSGVTIQLKDAVTGAIVATTTTDAAGNYQFLNVLAGNYVIMQVQPTGYNSVSDVDATPDPDGNDGTTPNDMIPVTVGPGENDNDNNFVEEQPGSISGTVLADTNNDNVGDTPLSGVTIQLKDAVTGAIVATTTTNASGQYSFTNVAPGNYTIMQIQPSGYLSVSDVDATPDPDGNDGATPNDMIPVTVTAGEADNNNDFVEEQPGNIRGNVTADTNNDNVGDTPLAGVTIQLKDAVTGAVVATTTTDASGNYAFLNQAPGNYVVMEVQPNGYISVSDTDATPDPDGNDGATPNDMIPVTLTAGENDNDNNFVEEQPGSVSGTVLADTNNDNVGDTPLSGVTIQLKDAVTGAVIATTTTNASGQYTFTNVAPGNYTIMQVQPAGYNSVSDVDTTPDPDGNDGATPNDMIPVTVTAGEADNNNDFVEEQPGSISGTVLADTNNDNVGDTPLSGVTIQLKDAVTGAVIATTTTNASGQYTFTNVAPGNYTIMQVQPAGYNSVSDVDTTPDPDGNDGTTPNDMIPVTVTAGEADNNNDFVEEQPGSISGTVLADTNNDNVGDTPLSGVTIQLKDAVTGAVIATTTTNASGQYTFTNVAPGNYTIMQVQPAGYNSVSDMDTTPDPDGNDGATPNDMIPVTVTAGEADNNNDFVEEQPGNIRGNVKADTNNDNVGDTPLAGVTIQLKDAVTGAVVATTTTDASGNYAFLNQAPGNYVVMEVQPNGYISVSDTDATPDPDGNDGATPNDMIPVTLTAGENDNDNNFVEEQPGSVSGTVLADTNNDNVGDTPLSGVTIQLKDAVTGAVIATTTTNASGQYTFTNVAPGNYTIMQVQPAGYNSVSDVDTTPDPDGNDGATPNDMIPVTVAPGEADNNNDFVEEQPGSISGTVLADTNNDNVGDTPLSGVTIQLKDAVTGAVIATTTTNTSGQYTFTNVAPGNYTIMQVQPAGYNSVSDVDTTPDPDGNDGATPNDMIPVTVTAGEADNNNDFVEEQPGNIRGNVSADTNNDGIGDTPIQGVTVQLKDAVTGSVIATTTTNSLGNYEFLNIAPGNYTIMETQPSGYTSVSDVDATPDPDGNDGATPNDMVPVTLASGENDNDNNFVERYNASLGNFVWHDLNANGVQDAGELGIANVVVRLFNSAGTQIATKVTDLNGFYEFTNLAPGTYTVKFDTPTGYIPTGTDKGGNDSTDSDASTTTGITAPIVLTAGQNNLTVDAGFYKLASIGDFVWEDTNANGLQDAFEPGIAGVTVQLSGTDALGNVVNKTTITDGSGFYSFTGLVPGTYTVTFVKPGTAYKSTPSNVAADDAKDSDASVSGVTSPVTLVSGENNMTVDAGYFRCAQVGDYIWLDKNLNNLQDLTDEGLNGITVQLYSTANPATPVQTTISSVDPRDGTKNGYYNFEVCTPGNYFIKVLINETLYKFVTPNQGVNDAIDSDVIDFTNKTTLIFTVSYASIITDIDAGVQLKPLPVTLKEFTGWYEKTKDINVLKWVTASEQNNDYFEVERSFRGSDFSPVGRVEGHGNSQTELSYGFNDDDIASNGLYTYRLKQVDFDGKVSYSEIITIEVSRDEIVKTSIWPNPAIGLINVEISAGEGKKVVANVFDSQGKMVIRNMINETSESSVLTATIDGSNLAKGVYYVMVNIDGKTSSHKLIVLE